MGRRLYGRPAARAVFRLQTVLRRRVALSRIDGLHSRTDNATPLAYTREGGYRR